MAQATGAEIFRPYYAALLAHAQLKAGQLERGLTVTGEALERVQRTGERIFESELYRIQGELIASSGGQLYEKAARRHLKAIAIARKQNARSLELRALISLTQLRPNDSRVFRRLGEFLRDFDEGADNHDIRLARALHTQAGS
jgi:predicted ATPase